jgi:glycosyltransferase involved in cell wall biosynthesis
MALCVVSAILFSPRGGSAHVARALARGLRAQGHSVTLVAGSRSDVGRHGDAVAFYGDVRAVDFGPALATDEPLRFEGPPGTAPLHPSYEDRPGAADVVFAMLDDLDYERQVRAWSRELERAGAREADVLHLHHLTPLNEAAYRVAPRVPVVGQLHGTELLMLEQIEEGPPASWRHAARWAERMRGWARRCQRLVVSPAGIPRAMELLSLPRERLVSLPNGVDAELFRPRTIDRGAFWRHALVEEPQGWLPGQAPGSARYTSEEVAKLADAPVLLYVGRFTAVKRLGLLIGACARAQKTLDCPLALVLVGGHPGEWEGEHPAEVAARLGVSEVFLAGWYTQEELPEFFAASDAVIMTSAREQFGQVLIEGMACGLPVIATRSLGPASIVEDGRTGWLVDADEEELAAVMVTVAEDGEERNRRGRLARETVCERFTWSGVSSQLAEIFGDAGGTGEPASALKA